MGKRYPRYKRLLAQGLGALLLFPASAQASPTLHAVERYEFRWNGIPLAALTLAVDEGAGRYTLRQSVRSLGIVNLFAHHTDETNAAGVGERALGGRLHYRPERYESHYSTHGQLRHILLIFGLSGQVTEKLNEPPDDPGIRPPVPQKRLSHVYDPLSLLMALRAGEAEADGFDGRRLYRITMRAGAPVAFTTASGPQTAIPYVLTRTPLAGLTPKELSAFAKGEPPLTLYMSDDGRAVPLGMRVSLAFGEVTAERVRECGNWQECVRP